MMMAIEEIEIGKRIRKDMGDLSSLAESLRQHGLLNPVVLNEKRELIAGHRRLEAAKSLGWKQIEARIIDTSDEEGMLELEIEENLHRKELAADELADGYERLDKLRNPGFFRRIAQTISRFFRSLFHRG